MSDPSDIDATLRFDIREEPWIDVRLIDGSPATLSLRDAFARAEEIREITGELPTQSFAILRLMLAILYRTLGGDPLTLGEWEAWYTRGLPLDEIDAYLDDYDGRFDLFDPERPFFQVADLATTSGDHKDVTPLILDLPSNSRLFTNRSGSGANDLSFAEAARWLVSAQAFEPSGIKSGAIGDPRVKGGKGYPIGLAWSGLLGGVFAQGRTLRETLLLNLVAPDKYLQADTDADLPPWEEATPDTAAERVGLAVTGPVRLYTWQSRRIRLFADDGRVTGCLVANGDALTPQNQQHHEPMTAWRFSEPQTKKAGRTTYMPREHLPERALWRGIGALLPGISPKVPKRDVDASLAPGITQWLAFLRDDEMIPRDTRIRLRAVGVVYGSNNSVVDEVLDDEMSLSLSLLAESNRPLARQAEHAVSLASDGVLALRRLAENLDRAAGGAGEGAGSRAVTLGYAELDSPYRSWLASLDDNTDPIDAIEEWKVTARGILRSVGTRLITQAPPAAWAGREVSRLGGRELITTPRAEGWFLRALTKTFGSLVRKDDAA